ncbi:Oidioi.mRNA.OKI2018_I69.PAR.g11714.t1.cds [Oikopleura dioica]|uniref:Oidioi.mRNA.OKI2018_I69.PAR.g11714.t1.cds n=1 Tax=Oikopleura dioica TaxID=34765 RepID=A0ABN7RXN2_OIKDI|nr:Oidioi.mRNA.OKI2018_I69.PAR.g11714.t1.cds [Oikopleura dioica]
MSFSKGLKRDISGQFVVGYDTEFIILSPDDNSAEPKKDLLKSIFKKEVGISNVESIFVSIGSSGDLPMGRLDREKLGNALYENAGKCQGVFLTFGESGGLVEVLSETHHDLGSVYDDHVKLVGITGNPEALKFKTTDHADSHSHCICLKGDRHGNPIEEDDLWLNSILAIAELANEKLENTSDYIPLTIILQGGSARELKILALLSLLSPILQPTLILLDGTGGLAQLIQKIVTGFWRNIFNPTRQKMQLEDTLSLFETDDTRLKSELASVTENIRNFEVFLSSCQFKDEGVYDIHELMESVQKIFTKYFILSTETSNDYKKLINLCIFPSVPVGQLSKDDCMHRCLEYSIRTDNIQIAENMLVKSANDYNLESWMTQYGIYEAFFVEAFRLDNADFMGQVLDNQSKNYLEDEFIHSPKFADYIASWMTSMQSGSLKKTSSVVYRSKTAKDKRRLRSLILQKISKTGLDLMTVRETELPLESVRMLLLVALVTGRTKVAKKLIYSGTDLLGEFIATALICRGLKNSLTHDLSKKREELDNFGKICEADAIKLLERCSSVNIRRTEELCIRELPHWGGKSCLELAIAGDSQNFVAHSTIQMFLKSVWFGSVRNRSDISMANYLSYCFPFLSPLLLSDFFSENDSYCLRFVKFMHLPSTIFVYSGIFYLLYLFYFAIVLSMKFCKLPVIEEIILWFWTLALLAEWGRKSVYNHRIRISKNSFLRDIRRTVGQWTSQDTWTFIEFLAYLMFGIGFFLRLSIISSTLDFWDFGNVNNGSSITTSMWDKWNKYWNELLWNHDDENCPIYFDVELSVGKMLSVLYEQNVNMRLSQYFYCFSFILSVIRTLELCTVSKHLGSKVKTLFGVLADLFFFLIILSFFMVAYGVSVQSIIYTNEWRYYDLFFGIFVRPFFSMFGELFLGEVTSYQYSDSVDPHQLADTALDDGIIEAEEIKNFKMTTCSNIHSRSYFYSLQNLAENEGKSIFRCPNPSRVVWFLMAGYQLIASALLLNLVIAMFSNTFNRINNNAVLVWKFQRFDLLKSYQSKPAVVPPLNLIYHPIKWIFDIVYRLCSSGKTFSEANSIREPIKIPYHGRGRRTTSTRTKNNRNSLDAEWFISGNKNENIPLLEDKTSNQGSTVKRRKKNRLSVFEFLNASKQFQ